MFKLPRSVGSTYFRRYSTHDLPKKFVPKRAATEPSHFTPSFIPKSRAGRTSAIFLVILGVVVPTVHILAPGVISLDAPPSRAESVPKKGKYISLKEVQKHNSADKGVWVVIENTVYDLSSFLEQHPGGPEVLESNAGKDVTRIFKPIHPPYTLRDYASAVPVMGELDPDDIVELQKGSEQGSEEEKRIAEARELMPHVDTFVNLDDFEKQAKKILSRSAWAYYSSGSDDEYSLRGASLAYKDIFFRPRVMRKVSKVDPSTTMLGVKTSLPIYISAAALARLGHPDGEMNLTQGAAEKGIIQMISSVSSCSLEEINSVRAPGQTLWWQFYVPLTMEASLARLESVMKKKMNAIFLTVDAVVLGKREADARIKLEAKYPPKTVSNPSSTSSPEAGAVPSNSRSAQFTPSQPLSSANIPDFDWEDISWMRKATPGLPFVVKGIQCVEDAVEAVKQGCDGIVLSNHGGRQLDFSQAPVDVLLDIRRKAPEVFDKCEVFVDGGIRRGTDVLKCIALGAKGVGLGRSFLFAQSCHGAAGVVKAIEILENEIVTGMRLLGVTSLDQLGPEYLALPEFHKLP